jgi:hypothetical protein
MAMPVVVPAMVSAAEGAIGSVSGTIWSFFTAWLEQEDQERDIQPDETE